MPIDVVACQTGLARHPASARARVSEAGGRISTVECFDKCEICERSLLVRVGGTMMRCRDVDELVEALIALAEP